MSRVTARRNRDLAREIRDRWPVSVIFEYWAAVAARKCRVRIEDDGENEPFVAWDEEGIPPTDAEVSGAVRVLMERGHGLPAQSIHLEAELRNYVDLDLPAIGTVPAAVLAGIRSLLRPAAGELPPAPSTASAADVIDAEIVREEPAPTVAEGAAPVPAAPADAPVKAP